MRIVLLTLLLCAASPALADIGVVRSGNLAGDAARGPLVEASVETVEDGLDRVGIRHRRLDDTRLSDLDRQAFDLVILPHNLLTEANVEALRRFAARGGRWIVYVSNGPPSLDPLLGVKPLPALEAFDPRALLPAARPGMPMRVPLPAQRVYRAYAPLEPGFEAGRWDGAPGVAALVRGPFGYYVNMPPGPGAAHADMLLAMVADLDPSVWTDAIQHTRRQALAAARETGLRWTRAREQPEFTAEQRARIERALDGVRAQIPPPDAPSPEIESNHPVLAAQVQASLKVREDIRRLGYQMTPSRKGEVRGLAVEPVARQDWDAVARAVKEAGLNSLFVRVGGGGSAIYAGEVLPSEEWAAGGADELKAAIDAARKHGLTIHAARASFSLAQAPRAFVERMTADDRLARDPQGRPGPFLNPADPRNLDQEFQAMLELVRKYDVDGVQFDSLQYPSAPHADWDYGPVSRREFERASGQPVAQWPQDVVTGARKADYENWERETLNRFLQRLSGEIRKVRPYVLVSARVAQDPRQGRAVLKQDWSAWAQNGWVDFLVAVDNVRHPEQLPAVVELQVSATRGKAPLLVGLAGPVLDRPDDVLLHVDALREAGAEGFVLLPGRAGGLEAPLAILRAGATAEGTWPGVLAPHAEWSLPGAVDRKDAPLGFTLGDMVDLTVSFSSASPLRQPLRSVRAELRLEDPYGRLIGVLTSITGLTNRKTRFSVPGGRFRPVLRGNMSFTDGSVRPFVIRGPLCEGLGADDLAAPPGAARPDGAGGAMALPAPAGPSASGSGR